MSKLANLKSAKSVADLASLLGLEAKVLAYIVYKMPDAGKYKKFLIDKSNGGKREISAPNSRLKMVQTRLAHLLYDCQQEIDVAHGVKKGCVVAHGYKVGLSIVTNAQRHRNKRHVFNVDLEGFFPSINFGRVYGFFCKNKDYKLDKKISTLIAQIACFENALPQGSPCSPVISNVIANMLDIKLNRLASKEGCTYTRYVDDLTFSTNKKSFPSSIAETNGDPHKWSAGSKVLAAVHAAGFKLNHAKTRMQYRDSRQDTTGLVVNKIVNVRDEYYKLVRAMVWSLITTGTSYLKVDGAPMPVSDRKLGGMLSFLFHVKGIKRRHEKVKEGDVPPNFYKIYTDYLNYKFFHGNLFPTFICEGKTDFIYLRCAIESLGEQFPSLFKVDENGKKSILATNVNYTKTSAALMGLSGGTGDFNNLLGTFRQRKSKFRGKPMNPVIMVVDNDSGSKDVFGHLSKILKKPVDGSAEFYHVYENLYVVPIPKLGDVDTPIERLFPQSVLDTVLDDGRKFDLSGKEKDGTKFYSKNTFATEVVRRKRAEIDFSGFEKLLNSFIAVTEHFDAQKAV